MLDEFECLYKSFGACQGLEEGDFEKNIERIEEIREELVLKMQMLADKPEYILLLATSQPWLLGAEVLELFEQKIFIGLPTWQSISKFLKDNLADTDHSLTPVNILDLGKALEG